MSKMMMMTMIMIRIHLTDIFINSFTDLLVHCVTSLCLNVFTNLKMMMMMMVLVMKMVMVRDDDDDDDMVNDDDIYIMVECKSQKSLYSSDHHLDC